MVLASSHVVSHDDRTHLFVEPSQSSSTTHASLSFEQCGLIVPQSKCVTHFFPVDVVTSPPVLPSLKYGAFLHVVFSSHVFLWLEVAPGSPSQKLAWAAKHTASVKDSLMYTPPVLSE